MSNLKKGDLIEVEVNIEEEDMTETRAAIAQVDVIETDVPEVTQPSTT